MNGRRTLVAIALVLVCKAAVAQPAGIQRASWLRGCWELPTPNGSVEEVWTAPKGGSMLGLSRTIRDGKLAEYEMVVLREQGDQLAYVAHPSGQRPATFLSSRVSTSELVFENPAHDFPQQIGYRVDGDTLLAWISGSQNGKTRRAEFPYKRVGCASPRD